MTSYMKSILRSQIETTTDWRVESKAKLSNSVKQSQFNFIKMINLGQRTSYGGSRIQLYLGKRRSFSDLKPLKTLFFRFTAVKAAIFPAQRRTRRYFSVQTPLTPLFFGSMTLTPLCVRLNAVHAVFFRLNAVNAAFLPVQRRERRFFWVKRR